VSRKKNKDIQFELNQKLNSEVKRYQEIVDQNNKFFARELQRLQLASSTERQRLVSQYEERIQQLQNVYRDQMNEREQYNKLNSANA